MQYATSDALHMQLPMWVLYTLRTALCVTLLHLHNSWHCILTLKEPQSISVDANLVSKLCNKHMAFLDCCGFKVLLQQKQLCGQEFMVTNWLVLTVKSRSTIGSTQRRTADKKMRDTLSVEMLDGSAYFSRHLLLLYWCASDTLYFPHSPHNSLKYLNLRRLPLKRGVRGRLGAFCALYSCLCVQGRLSVQHPL